MQAVGRTISVVGWHAHAYRRMWRGSITVSFLNPIFFLLAIGVLLGTLVDRSDPDLDGLTYLEFVAPALVAATAMQTAASVTTFPMKAGLKWVRTYHGVVATPVRVRELVAGVLVWAGVRVIVACVLFVVVAGVGGAFTSPLAALSPLAGLLCGLAFAAGLAAVTTGTDADQWLVAIFRFVLVPLFLFSGTFFPISRLPDWLEPLALLSPLYHAVELCRAATTGSVAWLDRGGNVLVLLLFVGAGVWWGQRTFRRSLTQ
jgi:lipooligosaccharide transport system permease protein